MHLYTLGFVRSIVNAAGFLKQLRGDGTKIGHHSVLQGSDSPTGETGMGCDTRLTVKYACFRSTVELCRGSTGLRPGPGWGGEKMSGEGSVVPRNRDSRGWKGQPRGVFGERQVARVLAP